MAIGVGLAAAAGSAFCNVAIGVSVRIAVGAAAGFASEDLR
jgi:hypothetical protein